MNMRVLIMCCSAFQMITAVHIASEYFDNVDTDLLLSNNLKDYKALQKRAKECGLFKNVFTIETKELVWDDWKYTFLGWIYNRKLKKKYNFLSDHKYDVFMFANIEGASSCIAEYMHNRMKCDLYFFEDGFVAYSDYYKACIDRAYAKDKRFIYKIAYKLFKRSIYYISRFYVYNPELLKEWDYNFKIYKISRISKDSRTVRYLKQIYDYERSNDRYDRPFIFFEESYYADGININDVELVKKIASIVGKDNILIKIHPRNSVNRFEALGYHTNKDTSVPWELIAICEDLADTVLITISSGSAVTSYFTAKCKAKKSLMLYRMDELKGYRLTPSISVFDKICMDNDYFIYPETFEELKNELNLSKH